MKTNTFFRKARKELGLKQFEFAKRFKTSNVNICKYELGINKPPGQLILDVIEELKKLNKQII